MDGSVEEFEYYERGLYSSAFGFKIKEDSDDIYFVNIGAIKNMTTESNGR